MIKPVRLRVEADANTYLIETTDDGSHTLVRRDGDLAFHSGCGAASECDHVYLANGGFTGLETSWPKSVLEVGFGTGLAMLRTLDRVVAANRPLHYVALEQAAVPPDVLQQLDLGRGLADSTLADQFLRYWDRASRDQQTSPRSMESRVSTWQVDANRRVTVIFTDAKAWLVNATDAFDTVYFDPFDPHSSPELWTEDVFANVARCLRPSGRLVTYCVKGEIRRSMAAVGFEVRRVPGPTGGKREVLIAIKLEHSLPVESRSDTR